MLRISKSRTPPFPPTLIVEGRLVGDASGELVRAVRRVGQGGERGVVDVSRVTYADGEGIAALRGVRASGFEVVGAAGLVRLLLEECAT